MNDIDYGALMLEAASQDVAAEQHARMTSTAKVAVSRFWPTLAAAEDEKDLGFRIAYLQDRMVRAMADAGVGDSVVQDEVIASLREDYRTMTAATTKEADSLKTAEKTEVCSDCNGTGAVPALGSEDPEDVDNGLIECPTCEGTGEVFIKEGDEGQKTAASEERSRKTAEVALRLITNLKPGDRVKMAGDHNYQSPWEIVESVTHVDGGYVVKTDKRTHPPQSAEARYRVDLGRDPFFASRKSAAWKPTPTVTTSLTVNPPHGPTAIIPKIAEVILRIEGEDVLGLSINGSPDYIVTRYSTTATTDYGNPDRSGRQSGDFTVYFPNGKTKEFHYGPSGAPRHAAEDAANSIANNARHFTRDASRKTASATIDLVNTLEGLGYTMTQPSPNSYLFRGGKGEVLVQKHGGDYAVSDGQGNGNSVAWYTDATLVEGVQMWLHARYASRKESATYWIYEVRAVAESGQARTIDGIEVQPHTARSILEAVATDGSIAQMPFERVFDAAVGATFASRRQAAKQCAFCEKAPTTEGRWLDSTGNLVIQRVYVCDEHTDAAMNWAGPKEIGPVGSPDFRTSSLARTATFASRKTASQAGDPRPVQEEDEDGEPLGLPADADPSLLMASRTAGHRRTAVVACRSCSGIAVASKGSVECMDCGATTTATPQAATASSGRPRQALPPSLTGRLD